MQHLLDLLQFGPGSNEIVAIVAVDDLRSASPVAEPMKYGQEFLHIHGNTDFQVNSLSRHTYE